MGNYVEYLLSIPKSLYVSFRLCPCKYAWKIPILVRFNCVIKDLKGCIDIPKSVLSFGLVRVGFGCVGVFDKRNERSILEISGKIEVKGKAFWGTGSRICVAEGGCLTIDYGFSNTAKMTIICYNKISIGHDVLTSWETMIVDTDFHDVIDVRTEITYSQLKPVVIGDNVWIGMRSVILKGSIIPSGSIIGAMSLVNKEYKDENCLIAGNPASVKKRNVTRKSVFISQSC